MSFRFPMRRCAPKSTGFTLVELLAALAVIGLLAAITIPVIGSMRERAQASRCLSNLRQLGMAIPLYAADNKGAVVPSRIGYGDNQYWPYLLAPILGLDSTRTTPRGSRFDTVLTCPTEKPDSLGATENVVGLYAIRYTINSHIAEVNNLLTLPRVTRDERIQNLNPTRTMIFMDSFSGGSLGFASTFASTYPHGGKTNVAYIDGHVETKTPAEIDHYKSLPYHVFWRGYDWGYGGYSEN